MVKMVQICEIKHFSKMSRHFNKIYKSSNACSQDKHMQQNEQMIQIMHKVQDMHGLPQKRLKLMDI